MSNYIVYDRYKGKLWVFRLTDGVYQEQRITENRFWFEDLDLGLGLWNGEYEQITRPWLRWYDSDGLWIPTNAEAESRRADEERSQRHKAEQRAEQAESENQQLRERLRELGIDPDEM